MQFACTFQAGSTRSLEANVRHFELYEQEKKRGIVSRFAQPSISRGLSCGGLRTGSTRSQGWLRVESGKRRLRPRRRRVALAVQHISRLIAGGGSIYQRPDDKDAHAPEVVEVFVQRAVAYAQHTHHFEQEWLKLQRTLLVCKEAWKQRQACFHGDCAEATHHQESLDSLSQIDFAVDCYASVAARKKYPHALSQQQWFTSGYMVAWRIHFLQEEDEKPREA